MKVQFWGTRGSYPVSGKNFTHFGGNTSCVSIHTPRYVFIFDAGTGIIPLGEALKRQSSRDLVLCLSHCHLDHIIGLPFFAPVNDPNTKLDIISCINPQYEGIQRLLSNVFSPPFFPLPWVERRAHITYDNNLALVQRLFDNDKLALSMVNLDHPGGSCGYRLTYNKKSICYITDTGHTPGKVDADLLEFVREADLMIYDATFTNSEFAKHQDWGHSTAAMGVKIAKLAQVKKLALFHHSPASKDAKLHKIEQAAKTKFAGSFCAYDGMKLKV